MADSPTPTPTPTPTGQPPAWSDDFTASKYDWQTRAFYNLFVQAVWEREVAAGTATTITPPLLTDSSPHANLQACWAGWQHLIDQCIPAWQMPDTLSLFAQFIPPDAKLPVACNQCSGSNLVVPAGIGQMAYGRDAFRLAAGISLEKGWQRKRAREIVTLADASDVQGNPAAAGQVARLLGTGSSHPENAGVPCYTYKYTSAAPAVDPFPGSYPKWVLQPAGGTGPDVLDSDDGGTGMMPGGITQSGDYLSFGNVFKQLRDALNALYVTADNGGSVGPVYASTRAAPRDTPDPGFGAATSVEENYGTFVQTDSPPDPDRPGYVLEPSPTYPWGAYASDRFIFLPSGYSNASSPVFCGYDDGEQFASGYKPTAVSPYGDTSPVGRSCDLWLIATTDLKDTAVGGDYSDTPAPCDTVEYAEEVFGIGQNVWFKVHNWGTTTDGELVGDTVPPEPVFVVPPDLPCVPADQAGGHALPPDEYGAYSSSTSIGAMVAGVVAVYDWSSGYTCKPTNPHANVGGQACFDPPTVPTTPTPTPTPTPTATPVTACTSCVPCCFQMGKGPHTWTPPCNGTLRVVVNDVVGQYANNGGQFLATINGPTPVTIAGNDPVGYTFTVQGGTAVTWSAKGTVSNESPGESNYVSTGPDGLADPPATFAGTECPAGNFLGMVGFFTPSGTTGGACGICYEGHDQPFAVGDSILSSRCFIAAQTCIDIGTGSSGTFTDSAGSVFEWSDTGNPAPGSYVRDDPPPGVSDPGAGVCTGTGNYISVTRTA